VWWRVPGEPGLLLHGLNWMPLLLDFGALAEHDDSSLETWTLDGDYVYKNIGASDSIHVVQDSDEVFLASWAPMGDRARDVSRRYRRWPYFENWHAKMVESRKGMEFRDGFYGGYFDPLKQKIFFLPVRWHAGDLNVAWRATETRVQKLLRRYVLPPELSAAEGAPRWRISTFIFVIVPIRFSANAQDYWNHRDIMRNCLSRMIRGDVATWRRVFKRLRTTVAQILG
jgi:hypothetical protein